MTILTKTSSSKILVTGFLPLVQQPVLIFHQESCEGRYPLISITLQQKRAQTLTKTNVRI